MNKPLFVLDTNSVLSAILLPQSISRQAFDLAFDQGHIIASVATLAELENVLHRPKFDRYITKRERLRFLSTYLRSVHKIDVTVQITDCRDPKDNKFLELAVSGQATCIVSGDKDLLVLAPYRGISIQTPAVFLEHYTSA